MQRAELHFHLLPAVDDGPADFDEAVALARLAVADGTSLVTVTPHVRDLLDRGILRELAERVARVADARHALRKLVQDAAVQQVAHMRRDGDQ